MGFGIFFMYLLRMINYSNKKIHILTSLDYLPINENSSLKIISDKSAYTLEEVINKNKTNIEANEFLLAILSEKIQCLGIYIYSGEKNIREAIVNRFSTDFSIIKNEKIKIDKHLPIPYLLSITENKNNKKWSQKIIFFNDINKLKSKCLEFNKDASILLWEILYSEIKYVKLG